MPARRVTTSRSPSTVVQSAEPFIVMAAERHAEYTSKVQTVEPGAQIYPAG